jgi:hypothetical protein
MQIKDSMRHLFLLEKLRACDPEPRVTCNDVGITACYEFSPAVESSPQTAKI